MSVHPCFWYFKNSTALSDILKGLNTLMKSRKATQNNSDGEIYWLRPGLYPWFKYWLIMLLAVSLDKSLKISKL